MNKKEFFGALTVILLASILFTQQGTSQWKGFAFFGLIFGGFWYFSK